MQLSIQTLGIDLTDRIKKQTYEKLDLALDRLEGDIESISVYLTDTNGPMVGGIDKACQIVVHIRLQDSLVVEDIDERVDVVIDRVTERLGVIAGQRADFLRKLRKRNFRNVVSNDDLSLDW